MKACVYPVCAYLARACSFACTQEHLLNKSLINSTNQTSFRIFSFTLFTEFGVAFCSKALWWTSSAPTYGSLCFIYSQLNLSIISMQTYPLQNEHETWLDGVIVRVKHRLFRFISSTKNMPNYIQSDLCFQFRVAFKRWKYACAWCGINSRDRCTFVSTSFNMLECSNRKWLLIMPRRWRNECTNMCL